MLMTVIAIGFCIEIDYVTAASHDHHVTATGRWKTYDCLAVGALWQTPGHAAALM